MSRSDQKSIGFSEPNKLGWKDLVVEQGQQHLNDLPNGRVLTVLGHLSDLHVCDPESPSRLQYLDRLSDPDSEWKEKVGHMGTYRAQEILTTQVVTAMVDALNEIKNGPLTNNPLEAVVVTGDMTDNAQLNETQWYMTALNGGTVSPVSGNKNISEWVGSQNVKYDEFYWHPDGAPTGEKLDRPISKFGFPIIKGLIEKARSSFKSTGLNVPWFATFGNHDLLLQGTVAANKELSSFSIGNSRIVSLPPDFKNPELVTPAVSEIGPVKYPDFAEFPQTKITADQLRAFNTPATFASSHINAGGNPVGHGFTKENVENNTAYWCHDLENVRLISMDTVNPHGGWQGSIDEKQLNWIREKLLEAEDKYCVLLSHHPSPTLINDFAPSGQPRRIIRDELLQELYQHQNLIVWVAGHVHRHASGLHTRPDGSTFLEFTTASHIDWPQQSRVIEIVKEENGIAIASTVIDHAGHIDWQDKGLDHLTMAGISRSLALNDWQSRGSEGSLQVRHGNREDRNVVWRVSDPFL